MTAKILSPYEKALAAEQLAMRRVVRALEKLPAETRQRVLHHAGQYLGVKDGTEDKP